MKKGLVIVLSVLVALVFASMVMAQANPPAKAPAPTKMVKPAATKADTTAAAAAAKPVMKENKPMAATKPAPPKERKMMGTVVSVDAVANTIVVKIKDQERTLTLDPAAKVMIAGAEGKLADLQKDAKVTVMYKFENKKRVALSIMGK
jgi:hypothetical protein